jgi:hypothetical protein
MDADNADGGRRSPPMTQMDAHNADGRPRWTPMTPIEGRRWTQMATDGRPQMDADDTDLQESPPTDERRSMSV